jgi:hypothetical protein
MRGALVRGFAPNDPNQGACPLVIPISFSEITFESLENILVFTETRSPRALPLGGVPARLTRKARRGAKPLIFCE